MDDAEKSRNALRRRLLKGMAGGAGIYTLPVGAGTSHGSIGACIQKSQSSTTPKAVLTSAPDTWVRAKLPYYTRGQHKYIKWNSQWYKVSASGSSYTASLAMPDGPIDTSAGPRGYFYGLADYGGAQGSLQVYPADTVVMEPVSGCSCWNSVMPGNYPRADAKNVLKM